MKCWRFIWSCNPQLHVLMKFQDMSKEEYLACSLIVRYITGVDYSPSLGLS